MNKYLALNVSPDGSFDLRTNQGYPGSANDDNKTLIFGSGQGTTQPSILLGGTSYNLKSNILQPTTLSNGTYTTVYLIKDMKITQQVKLVEVKSEFKYRIENTSSSSQDAGFYFHMDTMLGDDDRAPFIVNDNQLSTGKSYAGNNVPSSFDVFNNTRNHGLKAKGTIAGKKFQHLLMNFELVTINTYNHLIGPRVV